MKHTITVPSWSTSDLNAIFSGIRCRKPPRNTTYAAPRMTLSFSGYWFYWHSKTQWALHRKPSNAFNPVHCITHVHAWLYYVLSVCVLYNAHITIQFNDLWSHYILQYTDRQVLHILLIAGCASFIWNNPKHTILFFPPAVRFIGAAGLILAKWPLWTGARCSLIYPMGSRTCASTALLSVVLWLCALSLPDTTAFISG